MKSLLLIDDSKLLAKSISAALSTNFKVVGLAHDGFDGFAKYQELRPDFVLLDITMPKCSGIDCLTNILNFDPNAKVFMCSSRGDEETIEKCLKIGAKGFIQKDQISVTEPDSYQQFFSMLDAG